MLDELKTNKQNKANKKLPHFPTSCLETLF